MRDMFTTVYDRDALRMWFGGIDLAEWPDAKDQRKDIDVLVYDKIRWKREHYVPNLLHPVLEELSCRKLRFEVVRYGRYTHNEYRKLLGRSRSMIFLCENETQGMAYQEAMACNVPILAWDQGFWLDPNRERWETEAVPATSVPYFSERCGERFIGIDDFAPALDRFVERLDWYAPRAYVGEKLSLRESAELFMEAYRAAAAQTRPRATVVNKEIVSQLTA
jgi:glycosyltransferase involved in cell wall biosynthesis